VPGGFGSGALWRFSELSAHRALHVEEEGCRCCAQEIECSGFSEGRGGMEGFWL
jgi:hypothetical protein